jgi:hypothetical protein
VFSIKAGRLIMFRNTIIILSRSGGDVTIDMGIGLVTGFIGHFKLLIIIHYDAIANSHSPQFAIDHACMPVRSLCQCYVTGLCLLARGGGCST